MVRRNQRSQRLTSNCLHERANGEYFDDKYDPEMDFLVEEEDLTAALVVSGYTRHVDNPPAKLPKRRKATATTLCYGCGQFKHYRSNCPRNQRFDDRRPQMRYPLECLICKSVHLTRKCPSLPAVQQQHARPGLMREQKASTLAVPRSSATNKPNANFKRDWTAALQELSTPDEPPFRQEPLPHDESQSQGGSPVQVIDPAEPALSEESSQGLHECRCLSYWERSSLCICGYWQIYARCAT